MGKTTLRSDILVLANPTSSGHIESVIKSDWNRYLSDDQRRKEDIAGKDRLARKRRNRTLTLHYKEGSFRSTNQPDKLSPPDSKNPVPTDAGIILIDQAEDFREFFSNYRLTCRYVFIVPELGWNNDEGKLEGYEIAQDIVNKYMPEEFLQIEFLSFLKQSELHKFVNSKYRRFVQALPHYNIAELKPRSITFSTYSIVHYELIKHLAFPVEASIDYAIHELDGYLRPIRNSNPDQYENLKGQVIRVLDDLQYLENISDIDITSTKSILEQASTRNELESTVDRFRNELQLFALQHKSDETKDPALQSNYKVFILEDEPEYLKMFSECFGKIFKRVYPQNSEISSYNLPAIHQDIKEIAEEYDVFVLDLLFKDNEYNWLPFNGLELYQDIKRHNPYATIRVITALPRDVIARVAEKILDQEIPFSHIFTKTKGPETLKHSIFDRSDEIIQECIKKEKEKRYSANLPDVGFFSLPGVYDYIQELLTVRTDRFDELLEKALTNFELYDRGELTKDTPGWRSGQLPGPNTFKSPFNASTLLKVLPNVLTHRLFILHNLTTDQMLDIDSYKEKITGLVNLRNFDRPYLTTKLGFSYESMNQERNTVKKIKLSNLFPHEHEFLENKIKAKKSKKLSDLNSELNDWLVSILSNHTVYESYQTLTDGEEATTNPYINVANANDFEFTNNILPHNCIDTEQLTPAYLYELIELLESNMSSTEAETIIKIAEESFDELPGDVFKKLPQDLKLKLQKFFYETIVDQYYGE